MKILVLGAGYVGKALLSHLKNKKHVLYASTTRPENVDTLKSFADHVFVLNGSEKDSLQAAIDLCEAIIILVAPKNHENYEETYLKTAKTILEILKVRKTPCYILYTSSTSVYKNSQKEWCKENDALPPETDNIKILRETEKLYLDGGNNLVKTCVLRLGGIYGPGRELGSRARRLAGKAVSGNGEEPTNHIHLDDIVQAIEFGLNHQWEGVYNLVNDSHPSRKKLYSSLCAAMNLESPRWDLNSGQEAGYKVSNAKVKQAGFVLIQPDILLI